MNRHLVNEYKSYLSSDKFLSESSLSSKEVEIYSDVLEEVACKQTIVTESSKGLKNAKQKIVELDEKVKNEDESMVASTPLVRQYCCMDGISKDKSDNLEKDTYFY